MSVYRKDSSGKLVKIAGSLTQRWNMLMLPTKHTIKDGADYYEITDAANQYISALTEYTNYSIYVDEPNQTDNVYVKYKDKILKLMSYSSNTIAINGIFAKVDFYTLSFTEVGEYAFLNVDTEINRYSTNAVSNKAIYEEIEKNIVSPGTNLTISDNNVINTVDNPIFKKIVSENARNTINLDKLTDGVEIDVAGDQWNSVTFDNITSLDGSNVWYTENNIYYSYLTNHYKLVDGQWQPVVFNGLASFTGNNIWRHNGNTYYSAGSNQYILNETTMTWSQKLWVGLTSFNGSNIWQTGNNIYCSSGSTQFVLNKDTDEWTPKTWTGLTSFSGDYVWTDNNNYYYSADASTQFILNESTSTWTPISWNITVYGSEVWHYDGQVYMSYQDKQYQLDTDTNTWIPKDWLGLTEFDGSNVYVNGTDYYYGSGTNQYILGEAKGVFKVSANEITFNGQNITGGGDTSNFVQKNTMAELLGVQQDTTDDTVHLEFNNTTLSPDYVGTFLLENKNKNKTKVNNQARIVHFKHNADISKQKLVVQLMTQDGTDTVTHLIGFGAQTDGTAILNAYRPASWFAQVFGQNLNTHKTLELDTEGLWLDNEPIYPNSIRFDTEQSLTDAQKTQARTNLGLNDTGVAWGSITGTLSDQTDLQNNFNDVNQQLVLVRSNLTSLNNKIPDDASTSNYPAITFAESERQKSKNLLGVIGSSDGVVSINTDGLITFNYILPVESADYSVDILKNYIYLKKGHTYTFSIQNYTNISGVGRQLITCGARKLSDNTYIGDYLYIANNETTKTITPTEDVLLVRCVFYGYYPTESITVNFSCYLQLEENSLATDYQPYNGAIVHEKEIEPDLIYDKDIKNTISGTAYSNGLLNNTSYNIDFNKYKKISVNIGYYNVRTCIVIDFTTTAETDGLWHYGTCIWAFAPNTIIRIELIANKNSIKVVGTKIDASETVFDGDIMRILRIEGVK